MLTLTDGTRLDVSVHGEGPTTLVLLHGWTQDRSNWRRQIEALRDVDGLRLIAYDHRGHGGSDPAPEGTATIAQCADDLVEVLAEVAPDGPVVLAGHSMGSMAISAVITAWLLERCSRKPNVGSGPTIWRMIIP